MTASMGCAEALLSFPISLVTPPHPYLCSLTPSPPELIPILFSPTLNFSLISITTCFTYTAPGPAQQQRGGWKPQQSSEQWTTGSTDLCYSSCTLQSTTSLSDIWGLLCLGLRRCRPPAQTDATCCSLSLWEREVL